MAFTRSCCSLRTRSAGSTRLRRGQGPQPLLQDPGLAFHPPTLYLGYDACRSPSPCRRRHADPQCRCGAGRAMRPWGSQLDFPNLGITAGSYWAYYELGWGGWWFWDPVENASLMPGWRRPRCALGQRARRARGLRSWTMMLAVIAFPCRWSHIPRSLGHLDLGPLLRGRSQRGLHPGVARLVRWRCIDLVRRARGVHSRGHSVRPVSREGALVVNNLLFSVILGVVFVGTLYRSPPKR